MRGIEFDCKKTMSDLQAQETPRDRPFNPFRIAKTDTAHKVVADVLVQLTNYEKHFKVRQRARRPEDQRRFERIVETLVCDLTHRELTQPGSWLAISLSKQVLGRKDRYGSPVMSKALPDVLERLASSEMSFVELDKGYHDHPFMPDEPNRQTVIRAGKRLRSRIKDNDLHFTDLGLDRHEETIIVRGKEGFSPKNIDLQYEDTELTHHYRGQIQRINDWLEQADIEFQPIGDMEREVDPTDRRLVRIFNNGSFEQGGRLYGGFWQSLSNQQRLKGITINEDSVASLDFGQMASRIMYGMVGVTPQLADAYTVPGWEKHRGGVKTLFNAMLHATERHTRLPQGTRAHFPKYTNVDKVIDAIMEHHAPVSDLFYSGQGMAVMYKESQILVDILLHLIDEEIVALPIHDAVIVNEMDVDTTKGIMLDVFKEHTGVEGRVEVEYRKLSYDYWDYLPA